MSESPKKFYLTTPIYYVNARPHIGHAYTTVVADVIARRHRLLGHDTFFLTGTDEHGQKIDRSANAAGIPPQQFADGVSRTFRDLWDRMGITYNDFIRTTEPRHQQGVQHLFKTLQDRGHIYLSTYTGQYCVSDEAYVEGPAGVRCPDCGRVTETVSESNFYFRLSAFQLPLLNLIESNQLLITPDSRRNEVLSFLRGNTQSSPSISPQPSPAVILSEAEESQHSARTAASFTQPPQPPSAVILSEAEESPHSASATPDPSASHNPPNPVILSEAKDPEAVSSPLTVKPLSATDPASPATLSRTAAGTPYLPGALKDLSISRTSFKWGIPVPGHPDHVIYVWLDALANYMTAIGYGSDDPTKQQQFEKYWPADLHLVGKEIIRFHCVYWPAFLLTAGLPTPRAITAHGWLLFEDSKMSKSRGNIVRTETILDTFGTLCPPQVSTELSSFAEAGESAPPTTPPPTELSSFAASGGSASPTTPAPTKLSSSSPSKGSASPTFPAPTELSSSAASEGSASPTIPARTELSSSGASEGSASPTIPASAPPPESASLKGTASAVPSSLPTGQAALAAEVRSPSKRDQDLFASDVLRYFLLREIPFGQDGSFSFDALITRYNADLANGYGNLVSRVLKMVQDNFANGIEVPNLNPLLDSVYTTWDEISNAPRNNLDAPTVMGTAYLREEIIQLEANTEKSFSERWFHYHLSVLHASIGHVDAYLSSHKPWILAKAGDAVSRKKLQEVLYTAAESIRIITALLHPILPYATARVWAQLGLGSIEAAAARGDLRNLQWGGLQPGTKLGPLSPIFPRADKGLAQIMADIEQNPTNVIAHHDATPTEKPEFPEAPLSSDGKTPTPSRLTNETTTATPETPLDPTHPAAPPRSGSITESNPIAQVAGSSSPTTELHKPPSHTEVHPSGLFAKSASTANQQATPAQTSASPQAALPLAESTTQITIDDFAKVELRVARILVCERIPKADKLLRLEVDLGYERRQILSGIAEWYTPEELIGRKIVVITNLAPRKMRGLDSHGMLLAASTGENGKPALATFAEADNIDLGARLK